MKCRYCDKQYYGARCNCGIEHELWALLESVRRDDNKEIIDDFQTRLTNYRVQREMREAELRQHEETR